MIYSFGQSYNQFHLNYHHQFYGVFFRICKFYMRISYMHCSLIKDVTLNTNTKICDEKQKRHKHGRGKRNCKPCAIESEKGEVNVWLFSLHKLPLHEINTWTSAAETVAKSKAFQSSVDFCQLKLVANLRCVRLYVRLIPN